MPRIVGKRERVVDHAGVAIEEYAGNVATKDDRISIAHVMVSKSASEPWLTLHYDEWMAVLKGRMLLHHAGGCLEVKTGETVFIEKGERFRPEFPDAGTEYIPVCLPAFRPDRCIREDDPQGQVQKKLRAFHSDATPSKAPVCGGLNQNELNAEVIYHMCSKEMWDAAVKLDEAYFPPTFEQDGFTHATCVPARLITIANHFYQSRTGVWICLKLSRSKLRRCGIIVKDEAAMPVGDQSVSTDWEQGGWVCPHIYGGIPPCVVDAVLPITRDNEKFVSIEGVA